MAPLSMGSIEALPPMKRSRLYQSLLKNARELESRYSEESTKAQALEAYLLQPHVDQTPFADGATAQQAVAALLSRRS